jgi:hypothetical protein
MRDFMVFEKILVDVRVRDVAVREAVDFMFTLMRRQTARDGFLETWFENKHGRVEYSVKREEGDD